MNIKNQISILVAFLLSGVFNLNAQSLKEIVDDTTGKYIYAQARDNDATAAIELAEDELVSRVESYLGENNITDYNRNWKEWIKRIVNEKFGLTRAFLYLNVEDLKPGAIQLSETKRDYLGKTKSESSSVVNQEAASVKVAEKTVAEKAVVEKKAAEADVSEKKVVETKQVENKQVEKKKVEEKEAERKEVEKNEVEKKNSVSDDFSDFVGRILTLNNPAAVASELSRAKNLNLISIFGNSNSKYIPRAYIVVMNGSDIEVFAPEGDGGKRLNMRSGNPADASSARLIYWFLKKSK